MKRLALVLLLLTMAPAAWAVPDPDHDADVSVTSFPVIVPATNDYVIMTDTTNAGKFGKVTFANFKTGLSVADALGADDNYVTDTEKTRIGELEATDSVSFGSVTATGSGGLVSGVQLTTPGALVLYSDTTAFVSGILPAATSTATWSLRLPPAAPGGANYLFNVDADGTGGWTDPATLGGGFTNLTSFVEQTAWRLFYSDGSGDVKELALGSDGEYLKSNGAALAPSWATPSGSGDMVLAMAQTVTGKKTFENSDIALLGSSTGATTFASANAGATDYTLTFPAATATILAGLPSADNQLLQATGAGTYAWTSTLDGIGNITGAGSYNKITVTQPANGATLTLVDGSTLATAGAHTLTLTATADSTPTFPAGATTLMATSAIGSTVQAYDADLTAWAAITPSTGNLETTGTIQGNVVFNSYDTAQTLTYANHNSSIVQMTVAGEVTMWDCETAGVGATVMLWARDAEKIEVVPASGDQFVLFNGTGCGADDELDIAATAGTKVTLMCTADDTWSVYSETSASTDGGAAD